MPATLLLADDSVTIQRVIELTFADEDVNVVAVSDGDAAIARLELSPPDIVLADVGMPGRSGYDVAEFMKTTPRLAHIPVVLLTGAFEPIDRTRAAAVGCDGVLAKPFEPHVVVSRVKELLDNRPVRIPPAAAPAPRRPDLDAYFDQLDAAFANLTSTATARTPSAPAQIDAPEEDLAAVESVVEPPVARTPERPAERFPLPSLSDAFAALLSAEKRDVPPATVPRWPVTTTTPAAPQIDDQMIGDIARRVAAHFTEDYVRKAVNEIVSATAERLVREEIERIKATIK